MLFNSVSFLIFFPIVTLVYFLIPKKYSYLWLLAASYYFYMCWNPKYALLLLTSTAITYGASLLIERSAGERGRRWCVAASFCANLAILFFFKYFTFASDSLRAVLAHLGVALARPKFDVVLPVGISFYTFQALSYTADVYRGRVKAERNFLKYALFVSFFPQLVAGPIERTENLLPQLQNPKPFDALRARRGLVLMGSTTSTTPLGAPPASMDSLLGQQAKRSRLENTRAPDSPPKRISRFVKTARP